MNTIITIVSILILLLISTIIGDYKKRKKLSKSIKIGDKKRIFTNNELTFRYLIVLDIFYKKKKKIAKCQFIDDDEIIELPLSDLIY